MDSLVAGIPVKDIAAFALFALLWVGYTLLAEHPRFAGRSLSAVMTRHRAAWLRAMCDRDTRVADTSLIGNLMRSVAFFASASILVVGGLVALLGAGERGYQVYLELPFADDSGIEAFELKVVLLAAVFVYAFFQITWSLRQFNYCCVLIGAAPAPNAPDADKDRYAIHAARLQALAANTFNRGLRAYYFALAMLLWFVDAWVFLGASCAVTAILHRREFRSKTLKALRHLLEPG